MNELEQKEYIEQVVRWTDESYPRLAALVEAWTDADVKDFDRGLKLATALRKAHDFISVAYRFDAKKRVDSLNKLLREVRIKSGLANKGYRMVGDKTRYKAIVPAPPKVDAEGNTEPRKAFEMPTVQERRPDHLSDYYDKLPVEVQKRADEISALYLELAEYHGQLHSLSNNPQAHQDDIASTAKKVVDTEQKILQRWRIVDVAYALSVNKEVSQDDVEEMDELMKATERSSSRLSGEYTKREIDAILDEERKKECRRARIESNKKYLRRSDLRNNEARRAEVCLRAEELLAWGEKLSPKNLDTLNSLNIIIKGINDRTQKGEVKGKANDAQIPLDEIVQNAAPVEGENVNTTENEVQKISENTPDKLNTGKSDTSAQNHVKIPEEESTVDLFANEQKEGQEIKYRTGRKPASMFED